MNQFQLDQEFKNYLSNEAGATIAEYSSHYNNCTAQNLLLADRKQIWLTGEGLPQFVTFGLQNLFFRPKQFKCLGIDCWHDYQSNPKKLELSVSIDGKEFRNWTTFQAELKHGIQFISIDPISEKYNFIKISILETYGASKSYLNQVLLLQENPQLKLRNQLSPCSIQDTEYQEREDGQRSAPRLNIPKPNLNYSSQTPNSHHAPNSLKRYQIETMSSGRMSQSGQFQPQETFNGFRNDFDNQSQNSQISKQTYNQQQFQAPNQNFISDFKSELEMKIEEMNKETKTLEDEDIEQIMQPPKQQLSVTSPANLNNNNGNLNARIKNKFGHENNGINQELQRQLQQNKTNQIQTKQTHLQQPNQQKQILIENDLEGNFQLTRTERELKMLKIQFQELNEKYEQSEIRNQNQQQIIEQLNEKVAFLAIQFSELEKCLNLKNSQQSPYFNKFVSKQIEPSNAQQKFFIQEDSLQKQNNFNSNKLNNIQISKEQLEPIQGDKIDHKIGNLMDTKLAQMEKIIEFQIKDKLQNLEKSLGQKIRDSRTNSISRSQNSSQKSRGQNLIHEEELSEENLNNYFKRNNSRGNNKSPSNASLQDNSYQNQKNKYKGYIDNEGNNNNIYQQTLKNNQKSIQNKNQNLAQKQQEMKPEKLAKENSVPTNHKKFKQSFNSNNSGPNNQKPNKRVLQLLESLQSKLEKRQLKVIELQNQSEIEYDDYDENQNNSDVDFDDDEIPDYLSHTSSVHVD